MGYLEDYHHHGCRYSDPMHPLKVDGLVEEHLADSKSIPQCRLEEAFKASGKQIQEWAAACGHGRNWPSKCLKDPSQMTADDVATTCELIGCTLDYLRGWANKPQGSASDPLEKDVIATYYGYHLDDDQRRLVSELVLQLVSSNPIC